MSRVNVIVRELSGYAEMQALSECFAAIWDSHDEQIIPKETFTAAALSGHQVLGAFDGETMIGGSWGFLTFDAGVFGLHSHITGVLPAYEHRGAGLALKMAQKQWCLQRHIEIVTWTFDPMIARNAAFNIRKLGAQAVAFLPQFYGDMNDRYNAGEPTDRLEVRWNVHDEPLAEPPGLDAPHVAVPPDYLALRESDPMGASAERTRVGEQLQALFSAGLKAVWFDHERGYISR
ncbi:MAG: hypothetical protein NVSMB57_08350 [Actinomycetota bacterium]